MWHFHSKVAANVSLGAMNCEWLSSQPDRALSYRLKPWSSNFEIRLEAAKLKVFFCKVLWAGRWLPDNRSEKER